jgi:drug/metabolite transporter, DME family
MVTTDGLFNVPAHRPVIRLPAGACFAWLCASQHISWFHLKSLEHFCRELGFHFEDDTLGVWQVGNTVSLGTAVLFFKRERPLSGGSSSNLWFFAAGISNALSLRFLNNALAIGNVVAVVPIVSATPVFTLILGVLYFGREIITWRTVATIGLIVPGVILVALSGGR